MEPEHLITHWNNLRGRTYDLLDVLQPADLPRTLPFPESESLYNQLWCMLGTTESFAERIAAGSWQGWHSSLSSSASHVTMDEIRQHLKESDATLFAALRQHNLLEPYADGSTPLRHYFRLVEHESHHHGQLINFIFALNLPIPQSWADEWALSR
jgi:hypothetical protein